MKKLIEIMNKINLNIDLKIEVESIGNINNFILFLNNKKFNFSGLPNEVFKFKKQYNKNLYYKELLILNDFIVFLLMLNEKDFSFFNYYNITQNSLKLIAYRKSRDEFYSSLGNFKSSIFKNLINNYLEE